MAEEAGSEYRPRLGRGLAALLGTTKDEPEPATLLVQNAPIEFLKPSSRNPRRRFDDAELDQLAESIRQRGIIQPILVRAVPQVANAYEIIAGERRWRAAQRVGKHDVPIIVLNAGEREALEIAIVENVQRTDLNALEEAAGYARLSADYGYSHSDLARVVGKSRSHVANTLRLLNLPEHTQMLLSEGRISAGHARALLSVAHADGIADRIVAEHLTVRDIERLGERALKNNGNKKNNGSRRSVSNVDADTVALQNKLSLAIGARVAIKYTGDSGELRIAFTSFGQLDDFCYRLCSGKEKDFDSLT